MIRKLRHISADHLGMISAFICMIHCLITPVLFGAYAHSHKPIKSFGPSHDFFVDPNIWHPHDYWHLLDYVFLAIGVVAVWSAVRHAHSRWIKGLLWASLALLSACIFMEGYSELFANLLYAASGLLIFAHIINIVQQNQHNKVVCCE